MSKKKMSKRNALPVYSSIIHETRFRKHVKCLKTACLQPNMIHNKRKREERKCAQSVKAIIGAKYV